MVHYLTGRTNIVAFYNYLLLKSLPTLATTTATQAFSVSFHHGGLFLELIKHYLRHFVVCANLRQVCLGANFVLWKNILDDLNYFKEKDETRRSFLPKGTKIQKLINK